MGVYCVCDAIVFVGGMLRSSYRADEENRASGSSVKFEPKYDLLVDKLSGARACA